MLKMLKEENSKNTTNSEVDNCVQSVPIISNRNVLLKIFKTGGRSSKQAMLLSVDYDSTCCLRVIFDYFVEE